MAYIDDETIVWSCINICVYCIIAYVLYIYTYTYCKYMYTYVYIYIYCIHIWQDHCLVTLSTASNLLAGLARTFGISCFQSSSSQWKFDPLKQINGKFLRTELISLKHVAWNLEICQQNWFFCVSARPVSDLLSNPFSVHSVSHSEHPE